MAASIFNDVIGPVMRGASSSHVAGAERIASLVRQSLHGRPVKAVVDFDINGSLAASHDGHGSDMGFACGLMGIELTDPRTRDYARLTQEYGLDIEYRVLDYGADHPGNYRIRVTDDTGFTRSCEAVSTGGGAIELRKFEEFDVGINGEFCELLVVAGPEGEPKGESGDTADFAAGLADGIAQLIHAKVQRISTQGNCALAEFILTEPASDDLIREVTGIPGVQDVVFLAPVLSVGTLKDGKVPYTTASQLLEFAADNAMEPWEYGAYYECCRSGLSVREVYERMNQILGVMMVSVETGLAGTEYEDRILGRQSDKIDKAKRLGPCDILNSMIKCVTAIMESKSAMEVIVAAPTCGSCGCLPGTVIGLGNAMGLTRDTMVKGLLTAGLIGVFFAEQATFSAEVAGCQVECGAGSGMAAAAIVQMMGGSVTECLDAASVALQNITGLACDPVGNRVEVPCLGKNIMAGSNAISSANMILAGYDKVIPLDETIGAIYEIGLMMPLELRCTFGGLGNTATAREILGKLS